MKKLILILLCLPIFGFGQQTYVPDDNFEQELINRGCDNVLDDYVTTALIDTIIYLNVNGSNISDMTGIEDFTSLFDLRCDDNQLTSLDISQNLALYYLDCSDNLITTLDVSQNLNLTYFHCRDNQLTSLDISQNLALSELMCRFNQITSLNLSQNMALTFLWCNNNQLTSLDLRNGTNQTIFTWLSSNNNPNLTCINVDDVIHSTTYWTQIDPQHYFSTNCSYTSLSQTYVPDDNFEAYLEVNGMGNGISNDDSVTTALIDTITYLNVTGLNISDMIGIEDFIYLTELHCSHNSFSTLDISYNSFLNKLICFKNYNLTTLNLTQNFDLNYLDCFSTALSSLDVSQNTALNKLICSENQITSLDVSNNTFLIHLQCDSMLLTSLDVSQNTALSFLDCSKNQLTSLDVSNGNNQNIITFNAYENPNLTCINVDDSTYSTNTWFQGSNYFVFDPQHYFSTNCTLINLGCTDTLACNYNFLANIDDGSCVFSSIHQQSFDICSGDSVMVGVNVYNTTGVYTDTLLTINGCDSILYTNINLISTAVWQWGTTICDGDNVSVGNSIYNTIGVFEDTLTTSTGCDSIVYTNIYMIHQNTSSYDTLSVSASILWNGIPLNLSGDYSVTLINSVGCDSVVNLNLTITIPSGILNISNTEKTIVKITNMLGQETQIKRNTPLFYIYDDGTVEKKLIVE